MLKACTLPEYTPREVHCLPKKHQEMELADASAPITTMKTVTADEHLTCVHKCPRCSSTHITGPYPSPWELGTDTQPANGEKRLTFAQDHTPEEAESRFKSKSVSPK